jgi:hypothetical protein
MARLARLQRRSVVIHYAYGYRIEAEVKSRSSFALKSNP